MTDTNSGDLLEPGNGWKTKISFKLEDSNSPQKEITDLPFKLEKIEYRRNLGLNILAMSSYIKNLERKLKAKQKLAFKKKDSLLLQMVSYISHLLDSNIKLKNELDIAKGFNLHYQNEKDTQTTLAAADIKSKNDLFEMTKDYREKVDLSLNDLQEQLSSTHENIRYQYHVMEEMRKEIRALDEQNNELHLSLLDKQKQIQNKNCLLRRMKEKYQNLDWKFRKNYCRLIDVFDEKEYLKACLKYRMHYGNQKYAPTQHERHKMNKTSPNGLVSTEAKNSIFHVKQHNNSFSENKKYLTNNNRQSHGDVSADYDAGQSSCSKKKESYSVELSTSETSYHSSMDASASNLTSSVRNTLPVPVISCQMVSSRQNPQDTTCPDESRSNSKFGPGKDKLLGTEQQKPPIGFTNLSMVPERQFLNLNRYKTS